MMHATVASVMVMSMGVASSAPAAHIPAESVHYEYGRQYGYAHHASPYVHRGYGYAHKYGHHAHDGHAHGPYGHAHLDAGLPIHHGYVPVYGHHGVHDAAHGYAYGYDAIGPFDHHTGPFRPFGFYANFYHD